MKQIQEGGCRAATVVKWPIVPQASLAHLVEFRHAHQQCLFVMGQSRSQHDLQRSDAFCRVLVCKCYTRSRTLVIIKPKVPFSIDQSHLPLVPGSMLSLMLTLASRDPKLVLEVQRCGLFFNFLHEAGVEPRILALATIVQRVNTKPINKQHYSELEMLRTTSLKLRGVWTSLQLDSRMVLQMLKYVLDKWLSSTSL